MELVIEHNKDLHFKKVYCSEEHHITNYNEEIMDIIDFDATKLLYCPESIDVENVYYCITDEEYEEYMRMKNEAFEIDFYTDSTFDDEIIEEDILSGTTEEIIEEDALSGNTEYDYIVESGTTD